MTKGEERLDSSPFVVTVSDEDTLRCDGRVRVSTERASQDPFR